MTINASIFNNMKYAHSALHYIDQGNRMLRRMIPDNITLRFSSISTKQKRVFKLGQVDER